MANLIASRLGSYGKYHERAWDHLPTIGIYHIELPAPELANVAAVQKRLRDSGLIASSVQGKCDLKTDTCVEGMKPQLEAAQALGSRYCFLSVHSNEGDLQSAYAKLRQVGEIAQSFNVTVVLETHPDLVTNGDLGAQTAKAINHPNVKINFDTANVYYYNENITAPGELAKVIDHVAAVHLKDTNGGYKTWNFPALGRGVVNFPLVFKMLNERGFTGPFTMELEGIKDVNLDEQGQLQYVAESVAYLRQIGAL